MPLASGTKLGPYEILSLLGAGGRGEVYRARDPRLGREVAIKVLPAERLADADRRRRFVKEARAASALNHPNIVTIHEIESADGIDFIVMEQVLGKTLDELIPRQGMRLGEALRVAIPVSDALSAAHAAGIVHRDLKPTNVMVGTSGAVKVLDFGLAKLVALEGSSDEKQTYTWNSDADRLSRSGTIAGTPPYMSPEQVTGGPVDTRSDVFAFGSLLYEMVTGRRAFARNSVIDTLAAVIHEQPRPPSEVVSDLPRDLEKLILRCLRKEPERRFQHMGDVKVQLLELKEETDSNPAAAMAPAGVDWRWRLGALVAGMAILAGAVWQFRQNRGASLFEPRVQLLTAMAGWEEDPTGGIRTSGSRWLEARRCANSQPARRWMRIPAGHLREDSLRSRAIETAILRQPSISRRPWEVPTGDSPSFRSTGVFPGLPMVSGSLSAGVAGRTPLRPRLGASTSFP